MIRPLFQQIYFNILYYLDYVYCRLSSTYTTRIQYMIKLWKYGWTNKAWTRKSLKITKSNTQKVLALHVLTTNAGHSRHHSRKRGTPSKTWRPKMALNGDFVTKWLVIWWCGKNMFGTRHTNTYKTNSRAILKIYLMINKRKYSKNLQTDLGESFILHLNFFSEPCDHPFSKVKKCEKIINLFVSKNLC